MDGHKARFWNEICFIEENSLPRVFRNKTSPSFLFSIYNLKLYGLETKRVGECIEYLIHYGFFQRRDEFLSFTNNIKD